MRTIFSVFQRQRNSEYPLWSRSIEIAAIIAFSLMASISLFTHFSWLLKTISVTVLAFALLSMASAFLMADFISGLAHFLCDNFGSSDTKILGPLFIRHFLIHHDSPKDICHHDFIETNGNNFLACSLLLLPVFLVQTLSSDNTASFLTLFYLCLCIFLALTNQSHKWSHEASPPKVVRALQHYQFLLSGEEHAKHHRTPYDKNYCISSGILNKPLQKIEFFDRLYALILRLRRT